MYDSRTDFVQFVHRIVTEANVKALKRPLCCGSRIIPDSYTSPDEDLIDLVVSVPVSEQEEHKEKRRETV